MSLVLLLLIYFYSLGSKYNENRALIFLVMIMLVSTQMTQSHFAHHQAITFISLLYLLQNKHNLEPLLISLGRWFWPTSPMKTLQLIFYCYLKTSLISILNLERF